MVVGKINLYTLFSFIHHFPFHNTDIKRKFKDKKKGNLKIKRKITKKKSLKMKKRSKEVMKTEKQNPLPHKTFWASMGVFFLVSFLVMLSSLENSVTGPVSVTGHATIQNIATAKAGSALTLEVKTIPGVKEATIFFKEAVKNSQISFAEDKNLAFSGLAYVKFTVSSPDAEKIGQIDFTFKILEQDLKKANINFNDLRLFANDKEITTALVKRENDYYYYSASVQELGKMVLGQTQREKSGLPSTSVPSALPEDATLPSAEQASSPEEQQISTEIASETASPEAVSGKAAESEGVAVPEKQSIWEKIKNFFRNIFS